MYRHLREHTAEILECNKCDYSGTALNLKEHKRQHYKKYKKYAHCVRFLILEWNCGAINNIATGAIAPNTKTKWTNRSPQPTRIN